jgi:hypothetical protein
MHRTHLFSLMVILALLLTELHPYSRNQFVGARAAEPSVAAQDAWPAAALEESAAPSSIVTADSGTVPNHAPSSCPVTLPQYPPFMPPPPHALYPSANHFWYGTDSLWTVVPKNGTWSALAHNAQGYRQKIFWWRKDYFWQYEPEPRLSVTGRRLDAPAPPLHVSKTTNAFAEDIQSAMLVGVDFPTVGCWEITGSYAGTELRFVIWVAR